MTEQEAKALASELAHHKDWRVKWINKVPSGSWSIFLLRAPNDGKPGLRFFHLADGAYHLRHLISDHEARMIICL